MCLWGDTIKYLLLGYGISNQSVRRYFDNKHIEYDIFDDNIKEYKFDINLNDYDVIVKSPVITDQNQIIKKAIEIKKQIVTDIELFYMKFPWKKYITVTGTNGKTTTVNLITKIIGSVDLGGNVGKPIFDFVDSYKDIVVEASSFMLEYVEHYHSKINVFLNFSPNHLDHHHTFANYIKAKFNLLKNLQHDDYVIYNYDDKLLRRLVKYLDCNIIPFSIEEVVDGGYLQGNNIFFKNRFIMNISDINLMGMHNVSNIIASICAGLCYDNNLNNIELIVKEFKPIEHRIEFIGQINGIKIYNDSKSTNYQALRIALDSFNNEKILLICGGKFRADPIDVLSDSIKDVKCVLANGENKEIMSNFFASKNIEVHQFDKLLDVINNIHKFSKDITMVLFSPGAASYDQFKNYEERGKFFKDKIVFNKMR